VAEHIALDVCPHIYCMYWLDEEMRGEFDDNNKCALPQTFILKSVVTKNEREKERANEFLQMQI
jgi:hypothetical protein